MKKVIETKIQKRFADIDMFGHVNNIHQAAYLDLGKTDYYNAVLGLDALAQNPTLVIVSIRTDFAGQLRYGDDITVRTWVERVGNRSVTMRQQIVCATGTTGTAPAEAAAPEVLTESETVLSCFDRLTQASIAVPDEWRAAIEA